MIFANEVLSEIEGRSQLPKIYNSIVNVIKEVL